MRSAYNEGLTDNKIFENKSFIKVSEAVENVYLSETEIQQIYDLDLSNDKNLESVRDLFIISCCTALRFSDVSRLNENNFNNDRLTLTTQKTGQKVVIPLHWRVIEILNKYNGQLPHAPQNNIFNSRLRTICEMANINDLINVSYTKGGKKVSTTKPKYELITSHTGRRTAATNMYLEKVPTIAIMKITGHKTESSFMKYIKVSEEENAVSLLNHRFFAKNG
jgi:integrase